MSSRTPFLRRDTRPRSRHRRAVPAMLFAVVTGVLSWAPATPVLAARPLNVQQFMPNDTPVATPGGNCASGLPTQCTGDVLSDKFDGRDSRAHLTVVATPETTRVTWYACPLGMSAEPTDAAMTACSVRIGVDAKGVRPSLGSGSVAASEAYETTWDVPATLHRQRRDIVAVACVGSGQSLDATTGNCRAAVEPSIFLENAVSERAQNATSAGTFLTYRTQVGCVNVATPECLATFKPLRHGSPVPNAGFDFRARTSDDVGNLQAIFNLANAQQGPNNSNFMGFTNCTLEQVLTDHKRWRCNVGDFLVQNDAQIAVSLIDANAGGSQAQGTAGYCNGQNNPGATPTPSADNQVAGAHDACLLDVIYVVSSSPQATRVVQTFAANPPSPPATASCNRPDRGERSELGTIERVRICLFDQFGDPFDGPWTERSSGVGRIRDCGPEGRAHDHDGDGRLEDCHGTTGPDGASGGIEVANSSNAGDQTLTSCHDPENQRTNPRPSGHGCGNASGARRAEIVVHWVAP